MEYALLIALLLGLFLCLLSWLITTIAGFRHHFVTGIIAAIPILNLLVLPTIWHRMGGWFYTGIVGVILTAGAWFGGANISGTQHLQKAFGISLLSWGSKSTPASNNSETPQTVNQTVNMALPIATIQPQLPKQSADNATHEATSTTEQPSDQHELPSNALYQITFKTIELPSAPQQIGKYVRVMRSDQKQVEGKLLGITDKSLRLEQNLNGQVLSQEIEIKHIQQIEALTP